MELAPPRESIAERPRADALAVSLDALPLAVSGSSMKNGPRARYTALITMESESDRDGMRTCAGPEREPNEGAQRGRKACCDR